MKNLYLILLFTLLTLPVNSLKSQITDYDNVKWTPIETDGLNVEYLYTNIIMSDSLVEIRIVPNAQSNFWKCEITNKSADKLTIKWKNAVMGTSSTSRILFGDMRGYEIGNEVPDGILYKNSSIKKSIGAEEYIRSDYKQMIYYDDMKKDFKKEKRPQIKIINIIIPIEHNNETKVYNLKIQAEYAGKINKK